MGWAYLRALACVASFGVLLGVAACAPPLRGFGEFESPHVYHIPTARIANQVRCEITAFLKDHHDLEESYRQRGMSYFHLSETNADVNLTMQTDLGGSVTYAGIDLDKIGLNALGNIVAVSKDTPSLGAKISPTSSVSAIVAMHIDQGNEDTRYSRYPGNPAKVVECPPPPDQQDLLARLQALSLKQWLTNFFQGANDELVDGVGLDTVKLSTSFVLGVDVSSGINPLFGGTYILPVSSTALQFSPKLTHKLDITLYVCRDNPDTSEALAKASAKVTAAQSDLAAIQKKAGKDPTNEGLVAAAQARLDAALKVRDVARKAAPGADTCEAKAKAKSAAGDVLATKQ